MGSMRIIQIMRILPFWI